jgi:ABC-type Fe3+/spermidine/putrescine transport system ATPase subunit
VVLTAPHPEGGRQLKSGQHGTIAVRPEIIRIWPPNSKKPENVDFSVEGRITNRIYLGHQAEFRVVTDSLGEILARTPKTAEVVTQGFSPGDAVSVGWQWNLGLTLPES